MQTDRGLPRSDPKKLPGRLLRTTVLISACVLLAGAVGYLFGRVSTGSAVLPLQQRVPFEVYLSEHSFSEIENTKSRLEALSVEFLTNVRAQHDISALGTAAARPRYHPLYVAYPESAIEEIQKGIEEFKGTDQELHLVQELLCLFKIQRMNDRWLDLFLGTLYEHPTDPLISRHLRYALAIGETLGRQQQLSAALDLLRRIPMDFPAKAQAMAHIQDAPMVGLDPLHTSVLVLDESSGTDR